MTDPIEAMAIALSMADPDERGLPDGADMAQFYRELATAAYAALRKTLVPVGWMVSHPDYDEPWVSLHPVSLVDPEDGYTVTPLYALPEDQAMTAPEWAVEAWYAAFAIADDNADRTGFDHQAAALELSRRCVPIEEYQRVVGENVRLRESAAKIHNSVNIVGSAYHRAQTSLDEMVSEIKSELRAALKETGNAE